MTFLVLMSMSSSSKSKLSSGSCSFAVVPFAFLALTPLRLPWTRLKLINGASGVGGGVGVDSGSGSSGGGGGVRPAVDLLLFLFALEERGEENSSFIVVLGAIFALAMARLACTLSLSNGPKAGLS